MSVERRCEGEISPSNHAYRSAVRDGRHCQTGVRCSICLWLCMGRLRRLTILQRAVLLVELYQIVVCL